MKLQHLCFTLVLWSVAISCCKGQGGGAPAVPGTQDAVQIVAQAALCFDNKQVINGCLQSLRINVTGTSTAAPPPAPGTGTKNGSTGAVLCQGPCFKLMMSVMTCVNGVLGNIPGYSPGLMQGVQAIFQMSCGNVTNATASPAVASGSHVAVSSLGEQTSSAAGPTASLKSGSPSMLKTGNCVWVLLLSYLAF